MGLGLVVLCIILLVYVESIWSTEVPTQEGGGSLSALNPPTYTLYGYAIESGALGIHSRAHERQMDVFL